MKKPIAAVLAAAALTAIAFAPALAADPEKAEKHPSSQQDRFSHCAHESKGLRNEERHKFMSECLKGHDVEPTGAKEIALKDPAAAPSAPHGTQQQKMKTCNEEAHQKNLHGDERRAFMSACLKG
jgi:hypothetical protein